MPPTLTDVFGLDAFKVISLTNALQILPFKPTRIASMGLFEDMGVLTTTIAMEERDGALALLPSTRRGAPANVQGPQKRRVRNFTIPHIPFDDAVMADDLINVRAFGSADAEAGVNAIVNNKLSTMKGSHEVTKEFLRLGAIKGIILDGDGSTTLYNLFTEFGIAQPTQEFDFATATEDVKGLIIAVSRVIEAALGGYTYDHIHCFCGYEWFDAMVSHDTVKEAYDRYKAGQFLRDDNRKGFEYAGTFFEEYRGSIGGQDFIASDEAQFFPVGVPGLFKNFYAPADFVEAVGTVGLPYYAKSELMPMGRGIQIHTQSNPLPVCSIPGVLVNATVK